MTRKQRRLVSALRDGLPIEEAAAVAGYTQDYARRLIEEPSIRAAIDAPDPEPAPTVEAPPGGGMALEPAEMLRSIISDPAQDTRVRITATRALAMVERDKEPEREAPVFIDDVPDCEHCKGCRRPERRF